MREAAGLSLREVCRRTGWVENGASTPSAINPGRLSVIERGLEPTHDEAGQLKRILGAELLAEDAPTAA